MQERERRRRAHTQYKYKKIYNMFNRYGVPFTTPHESKQTPFAIVDHHHPVNSLCCAGMSVEVWASARYPCLVQARLGEREHPPPLLPKCVPPWHYRARNAPCVGCTRVQWNRANCSDSWKQARTEPTRRNREQNGRLGEHMHITRFPSY